MACLECMLRPIKTTVQKVFAGFYTLKGSPWGLYITFGLNILQSYNYFTLSLVFALYLTEEFGISDYRAGTLYGLWGTLIVLYGFIFGGLIDFLGVRLSLVLSFGINVVGRYVVASTTNANVLLWWLLGPVTFAEALGSPVLTIGIKRYTNESNRGFSFALFYSLMNAAALLCGIVFDVCRINLKNGLQIAGLPSAIPLNNPYRIIIFTGSISSVIAIGLSLFLKPDFGDQQADGPASLAKRGDSALNEALSPSSPTSPVSPLVKAAETAVLLDAAVAGGTAAQEPKQEEPGVLGKVKGKSKNLVARSKASWRDLKVVLTSREFLKYMAMCVFTVNLKSIFRHMDATLPKYQLRMFGCNAPVGLLYDVNPFMIIFLVPLVGALTTEWSHFDMIHYGSYVSALSPFFMVVTNAGWGPFAFVVMLSLGESIWSPRWYDYSMSVAPEGREGIFTALASAPLFAAKLPTGMISGLLLQSYCPGTGDCEDGAAAWEPGHCNGRMLWGIIGLLTLTSPLLILITQKWVRPAPTAAASYQRVQDTPFGSHEVGEERGLPIATALPAPHPAPHPIRVSGPTSPQEGLPHRSFDFSKGGAPAHGAVWSPTVAVPMGAARVGGALEAGGAVASGAVAFAASPPPFTGALPLFSPPEKIELMGQADEDLDGEDEGAGGEARVLRWKEDPGSDANVE